MVVTRSVGGWAADLGDQLGDGEPALGVASTGVVAFVGGGLGWRRRRRGRRPSMGDGDRL
jgi:hypothetical protein